MDVDEAVLRENKTICENTNWCRRTAERRVEEMNSDLRTHVSGKVQTYLYFSMALDDSTNNSDILTARLLVFMLDVNNRFRDITEK
jgi:hypothetical protein